VVSRRTARWWFPLGLLAVAAAGALLLWPVNGNGVSGNALRPHYSDTGWFAYVPAPTDPSKADLREASVALPEDVVTQRRRLAGGIGVVGLVLVATSYRIRRRA